MQTQNNYQPSYTRQTTYRITSQIRRDLLRQIYDCQMQDMHKFLIPSLHSKIHLFDNLVKYNS